MDMNGFVKANVMGAGSSLTENGALSYATTGKVFIDQFGKAGSCRNRDYDTVWKEQAALWAENPLAAIRFPFYLRMITRKDNIIGRGTTESVQRGAGQRDEAFKRLLWVAAYHPEEFYRNLWLLPVVGSWKDLWTILCMKENDALPVEFSLDRSAFYKVIAEGLNDENHRDLVRKYLPRIRSNAKCVTNRAKSGNKFAKEFAEFAGCSYKEYREFKTQGKAHDFQKYICAGLYSNINWGHIPGIALLRLITAPKVGVERRSFVDRHGLEQSYSEWLDKQRTVKYNGYAYELYLSAANARNVYQRKTFDKQFNSLIETGKSDGGAIKGNVLCAIDTSGSMGLPVGSGNCTALDVTKSLGIYFSEMNEGAFHNVIAAFGHYESHLETLSGTFCEKIEQMENLSAEGSTNYQGLIDLIVDTRKKNPDMPLEEFPSTLLVVSDMQFDPAGRHPCNNRAPQLYPNWDEDTNYRVMMEKLRGAFPEDFVKNFKVIWWDVTAYRTNEVPSTLDDKNTYFLSGFDGAIVSFVLGGEEPKENGDIEITAPTMEEVAERAISQEVLLLVN